MSGVISPFGKSGVLTDVRGLTIRAYCRVTSDNPSTSAFDRSYNIVSIAHSSSAITINFIEPVIAPYCMFTNHKWSTGNQWYAILSSSFAGQQTSFSSEYRKITQGATSISDDNLEGAIITIYGGIE